MNDLQPGDEESEPEHQDQMRTAVEVARRCLVLYAVVAAGHEESRETLRMWLHREGLWDSASPEEASLFEAPTLIRQQLINATWRVEALLPLLWALGAIDRLPKATGVCNVQLVRAALPPLIGSTAAFVEKATLRDEAELWHALKTPTRRTGPSEMPNVTASRFQRVLIQVSSRSGTML